MRQVKTTKRFKKTKAKTSETKGPLLKRGDSIDSGEQKEAIGNSPDSLRACPLSHQ